MNIKLKAFLYRIVTCGLVFSMLVVLTYILQLAYEDPTRGRLEKAILFAAIVFSSGCSWDLTKFFARQDVALLESFVPRLGKFLGFGIGNGALLYAAIVVSSGAGKHDVLGLLLLLGSLYCAVRATSESSSAISLVADQPKGG